MRRWMGGLLTVGCIAAALAFVPAAGAGQRCPRNTTPDVYVNPRARKRPGIRVVDNGTVLAENQHWHSTPKTTVGAGSYIDTDPACTGVGALTPPPP